MGWASLTLDLLSETHDNNSQCSFWELPRALITASLPSIGRHRKLHITAANQMKCILLMEGKTNALIFPLHSQRQNKNTDEGGDAEKQMSSSASESQEWMFQLKSKMFQRLQTHQKDRKQPKIAVTKLSWRQSANPLLSNSDQYNLLSHIDKLVCSQR